MDQEENILQLIIQKQSWEEVIYHIVSIENLDPWNIDLVKLTDSFLNYINKIEELDFRIPAKIVFVAAILLRLKADYLSIFEEEETFEEVAKAKPFVDLGIDPNLIQLGVPMKRIPKRQVTLDELVTALKKALLVRERRVERRRVWRAQLQAEIGGEDITKKIEEIMREIEELMEKLNKDKLEFSRIVEEWNREQIVSHFVPLLHLEQDKKIKCEQEEFFKEIYISKA
ncbi:MAG: segregation/condensation protein A [Candidatus Aenigmarchaeota archaeon]|nr:segregation/condensation protein A [Candidatus Aenigmarchaeota archaeon]